MSYDLMVFAPEAAPHSNSKEFLTWYQAQAKWGEGHSYDDPAVSTPNLRAWFAEIIQTFPPMNGPFAVDEDEVAEEDEALVTDYSVGQQMIYAGFAWSQADQAYDETFELAEKHRLGFFDASSDQGEVWLPDAKGHLRLAYSK